MGVRLTVNGGGFQDVLRQLEEFKEAAGALDGTVATLRFTSDPASVENAIRQMEQAVDEKVAPFQSNRMITDLAKQLKERYAKHIHEVAEGKK